ncbi:MAG TPA: hypothetical protein VL171_17265 [Verrucomicrobiae bacterium]|nr:hypothetical protein [Verrucomicrobiae bacterium]
MKICCMFVALLAGCAFPPQREQSIPAVAPRSGVRKPAIDLSDGVSKDEAQILADRYFRAHYSEGGTWYAGETATHWLFDVVTGVAAVREGTLYISKTNGVVSFEPK